MKKTIKVAIVAAFGLAAAACNTIAGAGEDVESVGQATTEAADDVKEDIND